MLVQGDLSFCPLPGFRALCVWAGGWVWRKPAARVLSSLLEQARIVPTAEGYTVWALHSLVEYQAKVHPQGGLRSSGRQLTVSEEEARKRLEKGQQP